MKPYALITAARNEESYLEKTIQSVISQTVLPQKWVIVSDGSTDRTDQIIVDYAQKHGIILPLHREAGNERHFGSKAEAFRFGYEQIKGLDFDFIGNVDADVCLEPDYYQGVLAKLEENAHLGIAGGVRYDFCGGRYRKTHCARNSVGGPFQLFRRQCYEAIGGYRALKRGGIDAVAEIMARQLGWEVQSYPEFKAYHQRCTGTAGGGIVRANSKAGIQDYVLGYHPLFEILRAVYRLADYPPIIGSAARLAGYGWATLKRYERAVPADLVQYLRSEQLARLRLPFARSKALRPR